MTAFAGEMHCCEPVAQPIEVNAPQPASHDGFAEHAVVAPEMSPLYELVQLALTKLENTPKVRSNSTNSREYFPTLLYPLINP